MKLEYRAGREGDVDEICRLVSSAIAAMEDHHIHQWDEIYPSRETFMEDIRRGELYVGLAGDNICVIYVVNQMCDAEYQNGDWKYTEGTYRIVHRLCVNPEYQHRGIAKATLLHMEEELRRQHIGAVRLDVFSENPFALALYEHCGYTRTGFADWRMGRFYLMEKKL